MICPFCILRGHRSNFEHISKISPGDLSHLNYQTVQTMMKCRGITVRHYKIAQVKYGQINFLHFLIAPSNNIGRCVAQINNFLGHI